MEVYKPSMDHGKALDHHVEKHKLKHHERHHAVDQDLKKMAMKGY